MQIQRPPRMAHEYKAVRRTEIVRFFLSYTVPSASRCSILSGELAEMDFHTDISWSMVFGILGGVLVVLGFKIWEAIQQKKTEANVKEPEANLRKAQWSLFFPQPTGKEAQEHYDESP